MVRKEVRDYSTNKNVCDIYGFCINNDNEGCRTKENFLHFILIRELNKLKTKTSKERKGLRLDIL